MKRALQADLEHLETLAFRRKVHCAPLLIEFFDRQTQIARSGRANLIWNIYECASKAIPSTTTFVSACTVISAPTQAGGNVSSNPRIPSPKPKNRCPFFPNPDFSILDSSFKNVDNLSLRNVFG